MFHDIHYLRPGQLGVVVHGFKRYVWNAWKKPRDRVATFGTDPVVDGEILQLCCHVPHGAWVLILSEALLLPTVASLRDNKPPELYYYEILWGEELCWVKKEHIINPYYV